MNEDRIIREAMADMAGVSIAQSLVAFALFELLNQGKSVEDARKAVSKGVQNVDELVKLRIEQSGNSDLLMRDFSSIKAACLKVLNQYLSAWE